MGFADSFRNMPPVTKNLLIINVVIWIAMALIGPVARILEQYGALYYITSQEFIPTQLVTYMFIHANFWHLLSGNHSWRQDYFFAIFHREDW